MNFLILWIAAVAVAAPINDFGNHHLQRFVYQVNALIVQPLMPIASDKQYCNQVISNIDDLLRSVPKEILSSDYRRFISHEHWDILASVKKNLAMEDFTLDDSNKRSSLIPLNPEAELYTVFADWLYKSKNGDKLDKIADKAHFKSLVGAVAVAYGRLEAYKNKLDAYQKNFANGFYQLHN